MTRTRTDAFTATSVAVPRTGSGGAAPSAGRMNAVEATQNGAPPTVLPPATRMKFLYQVTDLLSMQARTKATVALCAERASSATRCRPSSRTASESDAVQRLERWRLRAAIAGEESYWPSAGSANQILTSRPYFARKFLVPMRCGAYLGISSKQRLLQVARRKLCPAQIRLFASSRSAAASNP